ncbi:MAG: DegT/DnrJ/EryC1/StrS family aminotransferase [Phycisphaeraceae bacterium]|nr:DegT/DnrJ/EryC1/StrS family aminotransferase [Phycisphaeraceae bacterium]
MRVPLSRPDITQLEIDAVCDVLRSPNLSLGPKLPAFEQAFCDRIGKKRAIAVNSGTSALFLCLKAMGIGPGDEVITTPFTFIATATTIMMTGARPVFADIDPHTLNLDVHAASAWVNARTKAILPVEVFGNPAGMDTLREFAKDNHLKIIEDACEALGSELNNQKAGSFGDMSVFAFYPNKQMTTGEGGMILTNHDAWADLCVSLRNQGRSTGDTWLSHERLGYNFRISDINCALGLAQFSRLDEFVTKRAQVATWYQERLAQDTRLIVPVAPENSVMSWFVFVVRLQDSYSQTDRDTLLKHLNEQGIQASNYFPPLHLQPFISDQYGYREGDFPITESVSQRTIALPFYNNLSESDIDLVCRELTHTMDRLPTLSKVHTA